MRIYPDDPAIPMNHGDRVRRSFKQPFKHRAAFSQLVLRSPGFFHFFVGHSHLAGEGSDHPRVLRGVLLGAEFIHQAQPAVQPRGGENRYTD